MIGVLSVNLESFRLETGHLVILSFCFSRRSRQGEPRVVLTNCCFSFDSDIGSTRSHGLDDRPLSPVTLRRGYDDEHELGRDDTRSQPARATSERRSTPGIMMSTMARAVPAAGTAGACLL